MHTHRCTRLYASISTSSGSASPASAASMSSLPPTLITAAAAAAAAAEATVSADPSALNPKPMASNESADPPGRPLLEAGATIVAVAIVSMLPIVPAEWSPVEWAPPAPTPPPAPALVSRLIARRPSTTLARVPVGFIHTWSSTWLSDSRVAGSTVSMPFNKSAPQALVAAHHH